MSLSKCALMRYPASQNSLCSFPSNPNAHSVLSYRFHVLPKSSSRLHPFLRQNTFHTPTSFTQPMSVSVSPRRSPRNHRGSYVPPWKPRPSPAIARSLPQNLSAAFENNDCDDPHSLTPDTGRHIGSSGTSTIPPGSNARRYSQMSTQPPAVCLQSVPPVIPSPYPRPTSSFEAPTVAPDSDACRYSQMTTQPPSASALYDQLHGPVGDTASVLAPATPFSALYTSSDANTLPRCNDHRLSSEVSTMAPSEGVRLFSEMSTDPPSASARFYSDMTTQEPRSELHALSVDNSLASLSCQDAAVQYIVSPAENSASGEGVPQVEAAFTRREVLQFACNFIASHTDAVLRKVLKASRRKVSGSKVERISRAFLYLRVRIKGGEEEAEVFGRCRKAGLCLFRDYEDWLNENKGSCGSLMDVPPDEDLMRTFKQVEVSHWEELEALAEQRRQMGEDGELSDGASGSVGGSGYRGPASSRGIRARTEVIQFTLAYFVRLCILLRDDPVAKLAFRGTGLELTMEQQRNRVNRDDNWHTVAERFNSSDFQPRFEVPHGLPLENIEPSPTPVPPVSGIKLKTAWMDMRRPFTKANKDFERSGQNVTTLRGTLRFLKTKNGLPDGELYAIPKRILVMFIVLRIGSDNKGTDDQGETAKAMLNQALRMIPNGGGFDEAGNQNRSGSATSASEGDCEDDSSSPSSKKRKTSAISEDKRFLCMHLKGLTDSINIREAGSDGAYLAEFEESEKLLDMLQRAQDQLKIAERAAEDGNDVVLKLRKVRFDKVREQYERKFGEAA